MPRRVTGSASSRDDGSEREPRSASSRPARGHARRRVGSARASEAELRESVKGSSSEARRASSRGNDGKSSAAAARVAASTPIPQASSTAPGQFVDARGLPSEDMVDRTLKETSGPLGVAMRPKIIDFSSRLRERKHARLRAVLARIAIGIAALVVLAVMLWTVFLSPVFRLETDGITIVGGNDWVSREQIMAIADRQSGKSLFLVSSSRVVDALKDIPGVVDASADKKLPNRLTVTVTARRPAALQKDSHGSMTAVDGKGRVLNSVKGASTKGIPVIGVDDVTNALERNSVKQALKVLAALPESLRTRVSSVEAKTQDSITTTLDSRRYTVIWGDSSEMTMKTAVTTKLLENSDALSDYTTIDVSAPLRPIVR